MSAVMEDIYTDEVIVTDIGKGFLQNVLKPYRTNCQYLQKAHFEEHEDQGLQGLLMKGEFSIGESCYIDDTGHFNAVEYNICFNQIAYLHLGHCIKHGLIPELGAYDQDSFFEKQLSHFLIANLNSSFQSLMNARHFYGTFGIHSIKKTSKCIFMKTYCYFHDDEVGKSKGEVMLAILHP
jgi:hypothetical protein